MVDFCRADDRLVAVARSCPLDDPEDDAGGGRRGPRVRGRARSCSPSPPGRGTSPDPSRPRPGLGRARRNAGVPFMLPHRRWRTAAAQPALPGRQRPADLTDFLGGGENVRSKDYMVIHQPRRDVRRGPGPRRRLRALTPACTAACIEQGAMWVSPRLRRLDVCQGDVRSGSEPAPWSAASGASDYVRRQRAGSLPSPARTARLARRPGR